MDNKLFIHPLTHVNIEIEIRTFKKFHHNGHKIRKNRLLQKLHQNRLNRKIHHDLLKDAEQTALCLLLTLLHSYLCQFHFLHHLRTENQIHSFLS